MRVLGTWAHKVPAAFWLLDRSSAFAHAGSSKDYGRPLEMDTLLRTLETLLTSVIAGAGIATAIAAIWGARVARRQAKLTERSLAEQHEHLRLNLEVDLLHRMLDRYNSQLFLGKRSAVARHFLDNAFVDDDIV